MECISFQRYLRQRPYVVVLNCLRPLIHRFGINHLRQVMMDQGTPHSRTSIQNFFFMEDGSVCVHVMDFRRLNPLPPLQAPVRTVYGAFGGSEMSIENMFTG